MEIKPRKAFGKKGKFNDLRYFTQGVYPQEHCSFCKVDRLDEMGEPKWKSDFIIKNCFNECPQIVFTICPKCRELKLNQIFALIIEERFEKTGKEVSSFQSKKVNPKCKIQANPTK